MTASAIRGQAASITAAPGSSTLPSRSRSSRLDPFRRQLSRRLGRRLGARARRRAGLQDRLDDRPDADDAEILRRSLVHCAGERGERVLLARRDRRAQEIDAMDRAVREVRVGRADVRSRPIVPVEDRRRRRVDPLRVAGERNEPAPVEGAACPPSAALDPCRRRAAGGDRSRTSRCHGRRRRTS